MSDLPELPESSLRQIEQEEQNILRAFRNKLPNHGVTRGFQLEVDPDRLKDWIRIYARQLLRSYAEQYLKLANTDKVESALIECLLSQIRRYWLRRVTAKSAEALLAYAGGAMRDEFAKCRQESDGAVSPAPSIGVNSDNKGTASSVARLKPGPRPRTDRFADVLRLVKQVFGDQWKGWRNADLNDLAEALDVAQLPVPTTWLKREPKRKNWLDGLDEDKEAFKKVISYSIQQALKAVGSDDTVPPAEL